MIKRSGYEKELLHQILNQLKQNDEKYEILIIDLQEEMIKSLNSEIMIKTYLQNICQFLNEFRKTNTPTFVFEYQNRITENRNLTTYPIPKILKKEIKKIGKNIHYYLKFNNSAFTNISFYEELRKQKIKHLFVIGLFTSFCIYKSIKDAKKLGIHIYTSYGLINDGGITELNPRIRRYVDAFF